jgi:RNA polymerase sigma-70 factor (ECF subfamily)
MEGTEQEQKLRAAIEKLPEVQRQVLMLRYYSNLKFVEIAELMGCPLNTALGRMHKAVLKLRQLMESDQQRVTREQ